MTTATQAKFRFQVLRGSHRVGATYGERLPNGARQVLKPGYNVTKGGIVESNDDLTKKYPSDPPKYARVDRMVEAEHDVRSGLAAMTKSQLTQRAEADEIDISDCATKAEIVERIASTLED
jgi:hypothetical protein